MMEKLYRALMMGNSPTPTVHAILESMLHCLIFTEGHALNSKGIAEHYNNVKNIY